MACILVMCSEIAVCLIHRPPCVVFRAYVEQYTHHPTCIVEIQLGPSQALRVLSLFGDPIEYPNASSAHNMIIEQLNPYSGIDVLKNGFACARVKPLNMDGISNQMRLI